MRQCTTCGTGVTFPVETAAELTGHYPPEYGAFGPTTGLITGPISRVIVAHQTRGALARAPLAAIAGLTPGRVLDVGCGRGDIAAAFIARGWHATGVDPSESACRMAAAQGVESLRGTLATVELDSASFDAAYLHHSLEHSPDIGGDLRAIARALRPGAIVAVTAPNFDSWQRRRYGDRWYHLDLPRHRVHFTRAGLTVALEDAGFTVSATSTSTSSVGLPATVQYRLFGHCLFPAGLPLRVATGLCVLTLPVARLLDRDGGDQLNAVACALK